MSMRDLLLQLSQISSTLYQQTSPPDESTDGLGFGIFDFLLPFPELALDVPSPDSLTDILVGGGAPPSFARELSEIHAKSAAELADHYSQNYRDTCSGIASAKNETGTDGRMKRYLRLQQAGRRMYKRTIASWEKGLLQSLKGRFNGEDVEMKKRAINRISFNSNFGPILEEVFKNNPFPSLAVKRALAQKSGMSVGQINVWFQNHRSRARKEGQVISRTSSSREVDRPFGIGAGLDTSTSVQCKSAGSAPLSDCETVVDSDCETEPTCLSALSRSSSITLIDKDNDIFTHTAPHYAFPASYPPHFKQDPFPCRAHGDFSFPKPLWRRTPSSTSSSASDTDFPDMIKAFSCLTLKELNGEVHPSNTSNSTTRLATQRRSGTTTTILPNSYTKNVSPFVTPTYSAPLPFLIRRLHHRQSTRSSGAESLKGAEQIANGGSLYSVKRASVQKSTGKASERIKPAVTDAAFFPTAPYPRPHPQVRTENINYASHASSPIPPTRLNVIDEVGCLRSTPSRVDESSGDSNLHSLPTRSTPVPVIAPNLDSTLDELPDSAQTSSSRLTESALDSWTFEDLFSDFPLNIPLPSFVV